MLRLRVGDIVLYYKFDFSHCWIQLWTLWTTCQTLKTMQTRPSSSLVQVKFYAGRHVPKFVNQDYQAMVVAIVLGSRPDVKQRIVHARPTHALRVICPRAITANLSSRIAEDAYCLGRASRMSPCNADLIHIVRRHLLFSMHMHRRTQMKMNRGHTHPPPFKLIPVPPGWLSLRHHHHHPLNVPCRRLIHPRNPNLNRYPSLHLPHHPFYTNRSLSVLLLFVHPRRSLSELFRPIPYVLLKGL